MDLIDARFAAYVAVVTLLIMTPGPDMALVTRNALSAGRKAAQFAALGVSLGILGWGIASALGVAVLLERSAVAFTILKLAGAAYLIYLGVRSLAGHKRRRSEPGAMRSSDNSKLKTQNSKLATHDPRPMVAFRQGVLCNLLNPKAGVIFVSIVPQFVRPGDPALRLVLMLLAFEVILLAWLSLYGSLVARAGRSRSGIRVRRAIEQVTGAVLIGLGVRLALESR